MCNLGQAIIKYDLRYNPRLIQFSDGSQTEYVYSALGEKLKNIHRTAVPNYKELDGDKGELADNPLSTDVSRSLLKHAPADIPVAVDTFKQGDISMLTSLAIDSTEYIDSFIFENGRADKYLFPCGYYSYAVGHPTRTGGDGGWYYYLTDHLGNNRVVINDNGDIEQTTHYYPFGAVYADAGKNPDFQKYKYTGKELDLTHGLNTYDHGARQNYSILGVWDRVDPIAEKYYNISPYVVCGNNPTTYFDNTGKFHKKEMAIFSWLLNKATQPVGTGPIIENPNPKNEDLRYTYTSANFHDGIIDVVGHVGYSKSTQKILDITESIGDVTSTLGNDIVAITPLITIISTAFENPEIGYSAGEIGSVLSIAGDGLKDTAKFLNGDGGSSAIEDFLFSGFDLLGGKVISNVLPKSDIGRTILEQTHDSKVSILQSVYDMTKKKKDEDDDQQEE